MNIQIGGCAWQFAMNSKRLALIRPITSSTLLLTSLGLNFSWFEAALFDQNKPSLFLLEIKEKVKEIAPADGERS